LQYFELLSHPTPPQQVNSARIRNLEGGIKGVWMEAY
jgi:hypothetical protein